MSTNNFNLDNQLSPVELTPQWTQEQAIAFEAAQELLNKVLTYVISQLHAEAKRDTPDADAVLALQAQIDEIAQVKSALDPINSEHVATVRATYRELLRQLREQNGTDKPQ